MKIALLKNNEICYSSLVFFLSEIEKALQFWGCETVVTDSIDDVFFAQKWDAVIGINQEILSYQMENGDFLFDYFGCPVFAIIVDPPYHHDKLLRVHSPNLHLICLDEGHVQYSKNYYGPFKSVVMGYLLGAVQEPVVYKKREIDLLFSGTLSDRQCICDRVNAYSQPWAKQLFYHVIEEGKLHPNQSMEQQVLQYFKQQGMSISREDLKLAMAMVGTYAEHYLRADYRARIIETLLQAGIRVTVVGDGWKELKDKYPEFMDLRPSVELSQVSALTANAKISLNIMPWFKDGLHDRIPTSMHNGALCLTDGSTYIKKCFRDGENIVLYDLEKLEELPNIVEKLCDNLSRAEEIACNGMQLAKAEYTWEKFVAEYILAYMD